jgi:hypothetical protein
MKKPQAMHASEESLQRFSDGELGAGEADAIRRHVAACVECSVRLDAIGRASDTYLEYHRGTLKVQDPAPPRPWQDLRPVLSALNATTSRARGGTPEGISRPAGNSRSRRTMRGWLAVAAALIVAVAVYYRMNRPAPVSAAELLRKAAAVEAAAPNPARRIRVRTSRRSILRPAVLPAGRSGFTEPGLEAVFLAAHFSWQDPLSARSFAAWRDQLPEKQDRVRVIEATYEIHTTTRYGPLTEAVLVLDAHDLHPLSETFQFTGDRVEIVPEDSAPAVPPAPLASHTGSSPSPPAAGAAQELHVIAALHAIGADLGEAIQVTRRDGLLLVEATGLTTARAQQVRDAIAPIAGVTLRFDVPDAMPMDPTRSGRAATAAGVRSQLEAILGEEGVNRILDASEAVMARVYALRSLSRRFPQAVEAQFADTNRNALASIRNDHVSGIITHLRSLQSALARLLPQLPRAGTPPPANWQARAGRIFTVAQRVDHLLTRILAGGEDFASQAPELAEAMRQLDAEVAVEARQ